MKPVLQGRRTRRLALTITPCSFASSEALSKSQPYITEVEQGDRRLDAT